MESLVITWRELLIIIVLVLAVYIAEVILLTRAGKFGWRGRRNQIAAAQRPELDAMQTQMAELHERMEKMQGELEEMKRTQANMPYSQAIQLAQQGLDAPQVAANCGISRGEAELIVALYKANQA